MPRVDLVLDTKIERTPRVVQLEGIFDVPAEQKSRVEYHLDVPLEAKPWQVGLIVGPSGAGKTSVARHLFGNAIVSGYEWPIEKSVVDGFGEMPVREVTAALSSVGFSSPPSWLRPFRVLSNGEQFRATMARALVDPRPLVAVDEFTSVVDRQVAQVASHSIQKAVRAKPGKQFVAVSCHYDIEEWLQPDWILEPHTGRFVWRSLRRRPHLGLEIVRCKHEAWHMFAPHHYLSADLHKASRCFMGLVNGQPAAFGALIYFPHPKRKNIQMLSRVVVLPDYQGLGLGAHAFTESLARVAAANEFSMHVVTSHPSLVMTWARSRRWHMLSGPKFSAPRGRSSTKIAMAKATRRRVASFEWAMGADSVDSQAAKDLWQ